MRLVALIGGIAGILMGSLWIGKGAGLIHWPESSFMIDQRPWGYSRCNPHGDRPYPHCGLASAQVTALESTTRRNRQMPTGTVKFFNESKGFGFIQPEGGGADAFVHISDVERSGMSSLRENQRVSYDVEQDQRGKMKATNLKSADGE